MKILEIVQAERDEAREAHSTCSTQMRELEMQLANQRGLNTKLNADLLLKMHRLTLVESKLAAAEEVCKCGANQVAHGVGKYFCSFCGHPLFARRTV